MHANTDLSRRGFLKNLSLLASATALFPAQRLSGASDRLGKTLPLRPLGATGENVTMLGLGGAHNGDLPDREAQEMIESAIEWGVRFFDTAVQYQSGGSETKYGKFLIPKYRDHIFLMTKTLARDAKSARKDLGNSLRRLKTDRLDLWQAHSVESPADVETRRANGVFDELRKAKAEGKVRHIGFTGHRTPDAHVRVLETTDDLETCQMPINAVDRGYKSFIEHVLPRLVERKMGVLAMKTLSDQGFFGRNRWRGKATGLSPLIPDRISVEEAMNFVWSLPVSVLITGASELSHLEEKVKLARGFHGIDAAERDRIFEKVADLAGNSVEYYKA